MYVKTGYYGVERVSFRSMALQDILNFFRENDMYDWRCTVAFSTDNVESMKIDHTYRLVRLCPLFLEFRKNMDYSMIGHKILCDLGREFIWKHSIGDSIGGGGVYSSPDADSDEDGDKWPNMDSYIAC